MSYIFCSQIVELSFLHKTFTIIMCSSCTWYTKPSTMKVEIRDGDVAKSPTLLWVPQELHSPTLTPTPKTKYSEALL